jgi:hypothetical protein
MNFKCASNLNSEILLNLDLVFFFAIPLVSLVCLEQTFSSLLFAHHILFLFLFFVLKTDIS